MYIYSHVHLPTGWQWYTGAIPAQPSQLSVPDKGWCSIQEHCCWLQLVPLCPPRPLKSMRQHLSTFGSPHRCISAPMEIALSDSCMLSATRGCHRWTLPICPPGWMIGEQSFACALCQVSSHMALAAMTSNALTMMKLLLVALSRVDIAAAG